MSGLAYTGSPLNRAPERRNDEDWLALQRRSPRARVVPVWRERSLVARTLGPDVAVALPDLHPSDCEPQVADETNWIFLGLEGRAPVFAVDISMLPEPRARNLFAPHEFVDLRRVGPLLEGTAAAILAHARALVHWHRHQRHCGRCGSDAVSAEGGYARRCSAAACGHVTYPRTDPAIIVLVECWNGSGVNRCLLARHARLPERVYTTLAGFVEPGESLEEAVSREVLEEVGIAVDEVAYRGSQPWPFPGSIMLGFRASARSGRIVEDGHEILHGRWFSRDEIRHAGEWESEAASVRLPRRDSIARALIDDWLGEGA